MSNFIAERKILVSYDDKAFLDKNFDKCLKIYNIGVKHINKMLNVLYNNDNFNKYLKDLDKYKDDFYNLLDSYKRKKRFGKFVTDRSPGLYKKRLEEKCNQYNLELKILDTAKIKASQYKHDKDKCIKHKLSERTKLINDKRVQRDLYSAFLLKNTKCNLVDINVKKCNEEFNKFLEEQEKLIKIVKDDTKNFGLKDFKN